MEYGASIGQRVARARRQRGLSQPALAERMGVTAGYISKVERGAVILDRISAIAAFADALGVELPYMLGQPQMLIQSPDAEVMGIPAIEAALMPTSLFVSFAPTDRVEDYDVSVLGEEAEAIWAAYQDGEYATMGERLPSLIARCQAAHTAAGVGSKAKTAAVLTMVYCATKSLLVQVGELKLAHLALERAIGAADQADDPLLRPLVLWHLAAVLLAQGRTADALHVAEAEVNRLHDETGRARPELLSLYGGLALKGVVAAARLEKGLQTWSLWAEAEVQARRLGRDRNDYMTLFGPTNCQMIATTAGVDLSQPEVALRHHAKIKPGAMSSPGRESRHLVTVARAQCKLGQDTPALKTLLAAEQLAPEQLRYKPMATEVVRELRRRHRPGRLEELAARIGADDT
ncbi:hypothetical protein B4N89_13405 [Embleya scabrispora]|uniref:HTH cro/C1-type domain-containing protein n=1 Tax=Embleya scabrispora TaxID=159449 RepID=A0A1T3NY73_9ACTN|nr:helix-turn-helix transcriptional regulator [Embleya scabrispora]OPC81797.1 hypothetical protein B4N89_13405 [Embleya scabrispora]